MKRHNEAMDKKAAVYLDENVLRETQALAARTGRGEHEIVEAALRQYLSHESAPTLDGLRRRRDDLLRIAQQHGARNVRVFGSVARGDARPDSDVDFLVEMEPSRTLLDLSGLILDLQDALGREVNVVEIATPSRTADRIRQEAVPL